MYVCFLNFSSTDRTVNVRAYRYSDMFLSCFFYFVNNNGFEKLAQKKENVSTLILKLQKT